MAVAMTVAGCAATAPSPEPTGERTAFPSTASVAPAVASPSPSGTSAAISPSRQPSDAAGLTLVAVGDSIGYNSPQDCPGCTGFVDRYGVALEDAAGVPVTIRNLTEHNGLQVDMLLSELETSESLRDALASADAI